MKKSIDNTPTKSYIILNDDNNINCKEHTMEIWNLTTQTRTKDDLVRIVDSVGAKWTDTPAGNAIKCALSDMPRIMDAARKQNLNVNIERYGTVVVGY